MIKKIIILNNLSIFVLLSILLMALQLQAEEKKFTYTKSFGNIKTSYPLSPGDFILPYGTTIDNERKIVYITDCPSGVVNVYDLDGNFLYVIKKKECKIDGASDCFKLPADINFIESNNELVLSEEDTSFAHIIKNNQIVESYDLKSIGVNYFLGVDYNPQNKSFYVVSSENGKIFEFDRKFKIKNKIGYVGRLNGAFNGTYYLKYQNGKIFIVDQTNSRIKIYDTNFNLIYIIGKKNICSFRSIITGIKEKYTHDKKNIFSDIKSIFLCYEDSDHELAFSTAHELDLDDKGNIYIADTLNNRVKIYSSDFKLIHILKHEKIVQPKIIAISNDGNTLLVGGNQTSKGVHIFELNDKNK